MQTTRFIVVSSRGWWSFGKVKMYTYSLHIYTIINDALHTVPKWWPEDSSSMATYVCLPWRSIHAPAHPHTSSSFQITRSAICSSRLIVLASFQSLLGWDTLHSGHITSSHSLSPVLPFTNPFHYRLFVPSGLSSLHVLGLVVTSCTCWLLFLVLQC